MKLDDDDGTLLHISWGNVNSGAQSMASHILRHKKPDVVIAQQEDVIIAALVCNIIEVPLCIAHLNPRQNGIVLDCMPKLSKPIRSGVYEQGALPSVAIISTLIDNYRNVDELASYYKKREHAVKTLCVYTRKDVDNPPDYNWVKLTKFAKYIFPWQEK